MDRYLRTHLLRETPAEKSHGGRSPQPNSNHGKGRGGQLKHVTETPSSKGEGAPNLFYRRPMDDKGGPCHTPDCDGRSACMLQLKLTQKTKDGQEVKHRDNFRCTITCGFAARGAIMKMNAISNSANPKNSRKRKRNGVRPPSRAEEPKGGGLTPEVLKVTVTLEGESCQSPPLLEEEHATHT